MLPLDRSPLRSTCATAGACLTLALVAGCGGEAQPDRKAQPTPGVSRQERAAAPPAPTTPLKRRRLPTEEQVKAAQRKPIQATPTPSPKAPARGTETSSATRKPSGDLSRPPRELRTVPGPNTAPGDVLQLATRAGEQWLAYRVNGEAPDPDVVPSAAFENVPPMSPDQRAKGAAADDGITAISAHPQKGGWIVVVGTEDPRLPQVLVRVEKQAAGKVIAEISG